MQSLVRYRSGVRIIDPGDLDIINTYDGDDLDAPNANRPTRYFDGSDNAALPFYFELNPTPISRLYQGVLDSPIQTGSYILDVVSENRYVDDYSLSPEITQEAYLSEITYQSNNELIATVNNTGLAQFVSPGTVIIEAIGGNLVQSARLTFSISGNAPVYNFNSFVEGSVGHYCCSAIDSRISGKNKATNAPIYTVQNHSSGIYTRNTNCWLGDLDLTCVSPWNSVEGNLRAGTLLTPRHALFAAHFPMVGGATIRFVTQDNTVITRTVTHVITHPNFSSNVPDLQIGVLNEDVPATINYAKVLPDDYLNYLNPSDRHAAALLIDQEEKALVAEIGTTINQNLSYLQQPTAAQRLEFFEIAITGDSGSPVFLIIDNTPVLLTVLTFGGAGSGTSVTNFKDDLNQMILDVDALAEISTGYSLSEIDLTNFNDYE